VPNRRSLPFGGLPLLALGLAALACSVLGSPAVTPTAPPVASPAAQTTSAAPTAVSALTTPAADGTAAGAATATTPAGVNLSGTGKAEMPRLAFDAQGALHLVWLDKSLRVGGDILHRQTDANGEWSKAESLTSDFETLYGDLSLIRDGDGHICAVFAAAKTDSDPATIGLYQRCQAGAVWSGAVKLAITRQTSIGLRGYSPARGADGTVHAAYIASVGTIYFDNVQLSAPDSTSSGPTLVIDKAGGYHVAWESVGDANSPSTIQYRFSADQGQTWQAAQTLSTGQSVPNSVARLVADDEGNVNLLWGDSNVYYRRWTPAGGWGAPAALAALAGDQTGPNPALAVDAQGLVRVVWEHWDGLPYVVQAVGGAWGAPRLISHQASGEPQIVIDDGGATRVVWLANQDVYYLARPDFN
jgi:hypothetical protein